MARAPAKKKTAQALIPATSSEAPSWAAENAKMGMENITKDDIKIPRILLSQAISPHVMTGAHPAGEFYHNQAERDLGESVLIIPVYQYTRYDLWEPQHSGDRKLASASDGVNWDNGDQEFEVQPLKGSKEKVTWKTGKIVGKEIGLGKFGTSYPADPDSPPAATRNIVVFCVTPEHPDLGVSMLFFQKSGLAPALNWINSLLYGDAPIFQRLYKLEREVAKGAEGEYFAPKFIGQGFLTDKKLVLDLEEKYNTYRELSQRVAISPPDAEKEADDQTKGRSF